MSRSKIRTEDDLLDALDADLSWRIKELGSLRGAIRRGGEPVKRTVVRAGVALLYAHWEGFVKYASRCYLEFVSNQRLTFEDLAPCFVAIGAKRYLDGLVDSRKPIPQIEVVSFFRSSMSERASLSGKAIVTNSNLSSAQFEEICATLGLEVSSFTAKQNLIDSSLVRRRNKIAHGEFLDLGFDDYWMLQAEVIDLMRQYKDLLINAAVNEDFKA